MENKIVTKKQFVERHPWVTTGGLSHLIYMAKKNGFDSCLLRIGTRVLIDENRVEKWLETKRMKQKKKR